MSPFSPKEKGFLLFSILTGMSIALEYAITRPASHALFLTTFSSQAFPLVWLATVPLNLLAIFLYSKYLPKIGPAKMMGGVVIATLLINTLSALLLPTFPWVIFFQYAWKDIYVLLMFKQLWSMIHATISETRAKYLYGFIFGMGTLASVLGSLIPGLLALQIGSEALLFFTLPIYLALYLFYTLALKRSSVEKMEPEQKTQKSWIEGASLIKSSPFLVSVLLLVIFMQVSVGLAEYRFNLSIEEAIPGKDERTAFFGSLLGLVNLASGALQFLGGFLLLHFVGLQRSHLLIPALLGVGCLISCWIPSFFIASSFFLLVKAFDFSLFGVLREMLYVPLKLDEKFRAKAVIDVFAHRTSKALISLLLLGAQLWIGKGSTLWIDLLSLSIFAAWIGVAATLFKKRELTRSLD